MRILGILIYTMVTRSTPHKPSTSSDIQQIIWLYETYQKTLENFISYLYILDPGHKVTSIHETPDCFSVMEPRDEAQEKWSVQPQTPCCVSCYCFGYKVQEIAETIEKKRKKRKTEKEGYCGYWRYVLSSLQWWVHLATNMETCEDQFKQKSCRRSF